MFLWEGLHEQRYLIRIRLKYTLINVSNIMHLFLKHRVYTLLPIIILFGRVFIMHWLFTITYLSRSFSFGIFFLPRSWPITSVLCLGVNIISICFLSCLLVISLGFFIRLLSWIRARTAILRDVWSLVRLEIYIWTWYAIDIKYNGYLGWCHCLGLLE